MEDPLKKKLNKLTIKKETLSALQLAAIGGGGSAKCTGSSYDGCTYPPDSHAGTCGSCYSCPISQ